MRRALACLLCRVCGGRRGLREQWERRHLAVEGLDREDDAAALHGRYLSGGAHGAPDRRCAVVRHVDGGPDLQQRISRGFEGEQRMRRRDTAVPYGYCSSFHIVLRNKNQTAGKGSISRSQSYSLLSPQHQVSFEERRRQLPPSGRSWRELQIPPSYHFS